MFKRIFLTCIFLMAPTVPAYADSLIVGLGKAALGGAVAGSMAADEISRAQHAAAGNDVVWQMSRWRERVKNIGEVTPAHINQKSAGAALSFKKLVIEDMKLQPTAPIVLLSILLVPSAGSYSRSYIIFATTEDNLRPESELPKLE